MFLFCCVFVNCVVVSLQEWVEARSRNWGETCASREREKWRTSQGGTRWCGAERASAAQDGATQDGAARGVEPREAESQPLTEVPGQAGPDEGEGVEVVAPLVRKKRRLVRLGEATPTTEAPQADETKGSGVSVGQLEERPLAMVPAGELPQLALLPAVAQRQAGRVVRRGRAVQVRETHNCSCQSGVAYTRIQPWERLKKGLIG